MDKDIYKLINNLFRKEGLAGLIIIIFLALFAYQTFLLDEIVTTNRRKIDLIETEMKFYRP